MAFSHEERSLVALSARSRPFLFLKQEVPCIPCFSSILLLFWRCTSTFSPKVYVQRDASYIGVVPILGVRIPYISKQPQLGEKNIRGVVMIEQMPFKWRHFQAEMLLLRGHWYLLF
jgi:hypothetical protein